MKNAAKQCTILLLLLCASITFYALFMESVENEQLAPIDTSGLQDADSGTNERPRRHTEASRTTENLPHSSLGADPSADEIDGESILIRVVAGPNGTPVANASVYCDRASESALRDLSSRYDFDQIRKRGTSRITDKNGLARFPLSDWRRGVVITSPGFCGTAVIEARQNELTVALKPAFQVQIRVVDEQGKPVPDVPVCWRRTWRWGNGALETQELFHTRTSMDEGIAILTMPPGKTSMEYKFRGVAIDGLFRLPVEKALDPELPRSVTTTLVLPPHGALTYELHGGKKRTESKGEFWAVATIHTGMKDRRTQIMKLAGRRAQFSVVGLGLNFEAGIWTKPTCEFESMYREISGPTQAGEVVKLDFNLPAKAERAILSYQAVNTNGEPIADTDYRCEICPKGKWRDESFFVSGRTDKTGRFRIGIDRDSLEKYSEWNADLDLKTKLSTSEASFEISHPYPGFQDLGEIKAARDPVVLAGCVVTTKGEPIADATVTFVPIRENEEKFGTTTGFGFGWGNRAETDAKGRFVWRDKYASADRYSVSATAEKWYSDVHEAEKGNREVKVIALPLAGLKGRIRVAGAGPMSGLRVQMHYRLDEAGVERYEGPDTFAPDKNGNFSGWLRAGTYDLTVVRDGDDEHEMLKKTGVVLKKAKALDLGDLHVVFDDKIVTLHISSETNSTIGNLVVRLVESGETTRRLQSRRILEKNEAVEIQVPSLPTEVQIQATDLQVQRFVIQNTEAPIKLRGQIPVEIWVDGIKELPNDVKISVSISGQDDFAWNTRTSGTVRSDDPVVKLLSPWAGHVRVNLNAEYGNTLTYVYTKEPPAIIKIQDNGGSNVFRVEFTPEEVKSLIKKSKGK